MKMVTIGDLEITIYDDGDIGIEKGYHSEREEIILTPSQWKAVNDLLEKPAEVLE